MFEKSRLLTFTIFFYSKNDHYFFIFLKIGENKIMTCSKIYLSSALVFFKFNKINKILFKFFEVHENEIFTSRFSFFVEI